MGRPPIYPLRATVNIRLDLDLLKVIETKAQERQLRPAQLIRLLLVQIVNDNLFSAVLDDH